MCDDQNVKFIFTSELLNMQNEKQRTEKRSKKKTNKKKKSEKKHENLMIAATTS